MQDPNGTRYVDDDMAQRSEDFLGQFPTGYSELPHRQSMPYITSESLPLRRVAGGYRLASRLQFPFVAATAPPYHRPRSARGSFHGYERSSTPQHVVAPYPVSIDLPFPDAASFLRDYFAIPGGLPINLDVLPDGNNLDTRPPHSLHDLALLAIYGYPARKATLHEIRTAIQDRFSFFKGNNQFKFNGSLRHLLSFHSVFVKISRQESEPGHGDYWTLNVEQAFETKRPRKRRNKRGKLSISQARVRHPKNFFIREDLDEDRSSWSSSSSYIEPTPEPDMSSSSSCASGPILPPPPPSLYTNNGGMFTFHDYRVDTSRRWSYMPSYSPTESSSSGTSSRFPTPLVDVNHEEYTGSAFRQTSTAHGHGFYTS